jgi:hypothetical protein
MRVRTSDVQETCHYEPIDGRFLNTVVIGIVYTGKCLEDFRVSTRCNSLAAPKLKKRWRVVQI